MFKVGDRVISKIDHRGYLYKGGSYTVRNIYPSFEAVSIICEDGDLDVYGWSNFELDKNYTVREIIKDL